MSWLLLAAAALFPAETPEAKRVDKLRRYFTPNVGGEVLLDPIEQRDQQRRKREYDLRGFITVSPPKGTCFTLTLRDDQEDEVVCAKKSLSFTLADLDFAGRLKWRVVTGDGDFGTPIEWKSPYRLVLAIKDSMKDDDPPLRRFVGGCELRWDSDGERRIKIKLISGESWTVKFPRVDRAVDQPDPVPNLEIFEAKAKTGINVDPKLAEEAAAASKDKHAAPESKGTSTATALTTKKDEPEDEEIWHIQKRGSFVMSAANFMPYGATTPGAGGLCRYNYSGDDVDPVTPRVECQGADGFKRAIIPVSCLVRPK